MSTFLAQLIQYTPSQYSNVLYCTVAGREYSTYRYCTCFTGSNPNGNSRDIDNSSMLTLPKPRLLWALSMLGCIRNFVYPFSGVGIVPRVVCPNSLKVSQTRFQRRSRSDPAAGRTVGLLTRAEDDDDGLDDGWNTWEFGSWKVR